MMRVWGRWIGVAASALVALLAGCGASSSVIGQATAATQVPTAAPATATPAPTATGSFKD
jgi:hypothetical protein